MKLKSHQKMVLKSQTIIEIRIILSKKEGLKYNLVEGIDEAKKVLDYKEIKYIPIIGGLNAFGLTIIQRGNFLDFRLDPALIESTNPLVTEIFRKICTNGICEIPIWFDFVDQIMCINANHKLTARLFGTGIELGEEGTLVYKDLNFSTHSYPHRHSPKISKHLSIFTNSDKLELESIAELIKILFAKGVLSKNEEWDQS
jgi:hypothetical protein